MLRGKGFCFIETIALVVDACGGGNRFFCIENPTFLCYRRAIVVRHYKTVPVTFCYIAAFVGAVADVHYHSEWLGIVGNGVSGSEIEDVVAGVAPAEMFFCNIFGGVFFAKFLFFCALGILLGDDFSCLSVNMVVTPLIL